MCVLLQVQVFVQAWTSQGKAIVEKLRTGTFYPKQVRYQCVCVCACQVIIM